METIIEDYVSFEIAKLLKEKGFNEPVTELNRLLFKEGKKPVLKITLQKAMKWLREVHNLCIEPYRTACGYLYTISTIPYGSCKYNPKEGGDDEDSGQWTTYEGVCNAALKYALKNLI